MLHDRFTTLTVFLSGSLVGAAVSASLLTSHRPALAQTDKPPPDLATIAAELEVIKGKLPDQSHAMQDVSYHAGNLWFAGQHENWDLANFYWSETRSHLRWAVRIIPKRKDKQGQEIDLPAILQSLENSPLKEVQEAIAAKDKPAFEKSYRFLLEGCYACHKAVDKPFIHPQIPERPETPIVNFDPKAEWPR